MREEGDCLRNRKVASVAAGQGPRLRVGVGMEPHEAGKMPGTRSFFIKCKEFVLNPKINGKSSKGFNTGRRRNQTGILG